MNRVVGTNEKVGTDRREFLRRIEHQFSDAGPVAGLHKIDVRGKARRVHRHFRVVVRPGGFAGFSADRAIAKSGAFRGAGDDSDVLRHGPIFSYARGNTSPNSCAIGPENRRSRLNLAPCLSLRRRAR